MNDASGRFSPLEADRLQSQAMRMGSKALLTALQWHHPHIVTALQRKNNVEPTKEDI